MFIIFLHQRTSSSATLVRSAYPPIGGPYRGGLIGGEILAASDHVPILMKFQIAPGTIADTDGQVCYDRIDLVNDPNPYEADKDAEEEQATENAWWSQDHYDDSSQGQKQDRDEWDDMIIGSGTYSGSSPRGGGVIAISRRPGGVSVCVVENQRKSWGFPKGGRKDYGQNKRETVLRAAYREWHEETGLATLRLAQLPNGHADEATTGTRYIFANCTHAAIAQPDDYANEWQPPRNEAARHNSVANVHWIPVDACLRRNSPAKLSLQRVDMLRPALEAWESRQRRYTRLETWLRTWVRIACSGRGGVLSRMII